MPATRKLRRSGARALLACVVMTSAGCTPASDSDAPVITAPTTTSTSTTVAERAATTTLPAPTTTEPAPTTTEPLRDKALQQFLDDWAADNDPVGIAAAVLFPDGQLWQGAAGLADRENELPVEPDDRFQIGSITKTFMSVVTLRLAEAGVVELDAPIADHLPGYPGSEAITLRQLLGHRAGVFDPTPQLVSDRDGPHDPQIVFTGDELVAAAAAGGPSFPPGTRHEYSNANYWVLAAVLEAATGERAAKLLETHVIEPLGLDNTLLFDDWLPVVEIVNAYADLDLDGDPDPLGAAPLPGFVTPAWTAGAMVSTAEELVMFLDTLFAGGLVSEESLAAMLDTRSGGGTYALGIYRSGALWGHDGGIFGFLAAVFHDPDTGVTVAALTNRFGPAAPQADAFAKRLANLAGDLAAN